jgi:pimeloyl-ACP methyl ester carboxylesterase
MTIFSMTKSDGTVLSYTALGDPSALPPLVCHPGGPGMSAAYFGNLCGLGSARRVVLLNPRGTGGSSPPLDGRYELEKYAADIDELRAHLGAETIDLLGHSAGGFAAMTYALTYPHRLRKLVLVCTTPRFSPELREEREAAFAAHKNQPWFEDAVDAQRRRHAGEFDSAEEAAGLYAREMRLWFAGDGPAADTFLADFRNQRPDLNALRYFNQHLAADYDLRPRLHEIHAPTLIINGEADFFGPQISARDLAAIPRSRLALIPNAGHWPFTEAPDRFRAEVEAFLRDAVA